MRKLKTGLFLFSSAVWTKQNSLKLGSKKMSHQAKPDGCSTGCHQGHLITWQAASASLTPGIHYPERQRCVIKGDAPRTMFSATLNERALCKLSRHPIASNAWAGVLTSVNMTRAESRCQPCPSTYKVSCRVGIPQRIGQLQLCKVLKFTST